MLIVFCIPPSEIKRVVSTTSYFQRTEADILQVSDNHPPNFAFYERITAENGLAVAGVSGGLIKVFFSRPRGALGKSSGETLGSNIPPMLAAQSEFPSGPLLRFH